MRLTIATPCNADWDDMAGDARVRFCGKCEKNVYNLSALSRAAAQTLVEEREGRICVRFYQRTDGTMLTTDCPVAVERKRLRARVWARISGAAASLALLVGLSAGRARADVSVTDGSSDGKPTPARPKPVMPLRMAPNKPVPPKQPEKHAGKKREKPTVEHFQGALVLPDDI